jgi:hypothetical protein
MFPLRDGHPVRENYSSRSSIAKLEEAAQVEHNVAAYVDTTVLYRCRDGT